MRTFIILLLVTVLGVGAWWWKNDLTAFAKQADHLKSWLQPDPVGTEIAAMPNGSRFAADAEKAKSLADVSTMVGNMAIDVTTARTAVAAAQSLHKRVASSCGNDTQRVLTMLADANEKGERLKATLAEVDSWLQTMTAFVQEKRPTGGPLAAGYYRDFQRHRIELEESADTFKSLIEATPRLRKSNCELLEIPAFRERN